MKKSIGLMILSVLVVSNLAGAALISGVTVGGVSSQVTDWAYEIADNTINGSGYDPVTGIVSTDYQTMWEATSGDATPWIVWNLSSVQTLESMKVWNYNRSDGSTWYLRHYGARNVDIYLSVDSNPSTAIWTKVMSPVLNIAPEGQGAYSYNTPDILNLGNQQAQLVKMVINDTYMAPIGWGATGGSAGLSEVQFFTPEPATLTLLTLAGLGLLRRRSR